MSFGALTDHEGFLEGMVVLPWAAVFAIAFFVWASKKGGRDLARFGALFILGQAASLQLIVCGNKIGYQHYFTPDRLFSDGPMPALLIVFFEAALVLSSFKKITGAFRVFTPKQLIVIGGIFFITASTLSENPVHYVFELFFATFIQLIHLGALLLAVRDAPEVKIDLSHPRLPLFAALWVTLLAIVFAVFSYERHPHVPDEVVYLYHARYFAEGMLTMPLPAAPEAFNVDLMMYDADRWYCPVPLGWPAMLSVGAFFGAEWLVNPLLAGAGVLLAHATVRNVYGEKTARLVTVLIATSPWYLFLAMTFMTHTFTMFACLVACWSFSRLHLRRRIGYALLSGVFIGVVSLIRPLEGVAVAATLGVWALFFELPWVERIKSVVAMAFSSAVVGVIQLPYNQYLTGNPMKFPIMAYTDKYYGKGSNDLGFGANRGLGWTGLDPFPGHGPLDVLVNGNLNLFQINCELHGWAIGSMLLIAICLFSRKMRKADWGFFGGAFVVVFLQSFYWFSGGPDFGARYWFLTFLPCIVLTVRGFEILTSDLSAPNQSRATLALALLVSSTVVSYLPWRAIDKYHHYRLMRPDVRRLAERYDFGKSLVIIRGNRHPDFGSSVTYNPIDFGEPRPVYAWERGDPEILVEAVEAYPDRKVWIVAGPTLTGRGFEVQAGPLTGVHQVLEALRSKRHIPTVRGTQD